ncbi:PhzF family phenazine biosynthesis protein [Vibrio nigripulchritudo]|uniref:PhzF family phenazine biosynthesis protein n=1 Tax=Vibrio nigripulchritudo TaxID=28173 RepID=UPI0024936A80|nr:PhzF family phenazine biosynthesis protein [Vibrio nigripulchritudo]BDU39751.1 phenazine biosynthesis protein PhzF [Vibrio nigripulchritudo]BDU45474.1 phenazine biosynthesis protein PhzF [Vibrio nigripulchritudo]
MKLRMRVFDAFTDKRFKGNSAAVVITENWLSDELMQNIAIENNLSETAYLIPEGGNKYAIRWFSPITEIDFCGHATLASSYALFSDFPEYDELEFSTNEVGNLTVKKREDGMIEMRFPIRAPEPVDVPEPLLEGLSIRPVKVLRSPQAYFAIYDNESDVLNVEQVQESLKKLAPYDVVVTARGSSHDFVSRYFWPANGGDEDPVTGSIHAGLAPYWAEVLGKSELKALQASRRSGELDCRVTKDSVYVSGKAVKYLEGEIEV